LLIRNRKDLAVKVGLVKNQIHALVTRNIMDEEMKSVSDWFGVAGIRKLVSLPFPPVERAHLARYLEQLELLANQEESMQAELAKVAVERKDMQLLMTIPGVGYYTAVGMVAEIGDIHRFTTKQKLASYAGLVPRANNSGETVSEHQPVKKGNMVLKSFFCTAVIGMMRSGQTTAVTAFYREKAKTRPAQKALVASVRKLSGEVWKILTFEVPYREEDTNLTERKEKRMLRQAEEPTRDVTAEQLEILADRLSGKAEILQRLESETGSGDGEMKDAG
jgi:transposase